MLTFYEPTKWSMIVMDGNQPVARARKYGVGYWLLTLENASWVDQRARQPLRKDFPINFQDMFSKYPNMLAIKSKTEARKILKDLATFKPYDMEI